MTTNHLPEYSLLIATVGGTYQPVVQSLLHWRPARVLFLPSTQSRSTVDEAVRDHGARSGQPLNPGCYEVITIDDPQDFEGCLETFRKLDEHVRNWTERGVEFTVVVDFTAGTKCMSAALALQARRWPCRFSYVGGAVRTKDGLGTVETGSESVLHSANPWDALGFQAAEEFVILFDQLAFEQAARIADLSLRRVVAPSRKRELSALKLLAQAYDAWDRFDHSSAKTKLGDVERQRNDLASLLGEDAASRLLQHTRQNREYLQQLIDGSRPSRHLILDLLANADRCFQRGRLDDAVARLYRAIEAIAQLQLVMAHGIAGTDRVPMERIPEPLRTKFQDNEEDGHVKLGLQDAYALLDALGDDIGARFKQAGLHEPSRSPLVVRNQSILAHGFQPVSQRVYEPLRDAVATLLAITPDELPSFPTIASSAGS